MNRVRKYREAAGLSQSELARRTGLARNTIHLLETRGSKLQMQTAALISKALHVPVGILTADGNDEHSWQDAKYNPDDEGDYLVAYKLGKKYYYRTLAWVSGEWWETSIDGEMIEPFYYDISWWAKISEPHI